ncbi:MAG: ferric reductase-like transmembrane domain-containing protein [Planctomycetes bacterium]|nr:ferric reductase-like transmembrane domain-containing protein [Planctomycetota bacterium]
MEQLDGANDARGLTRGPYLRAGRLPSTSAWLVLYVAILVGPLLAAAGIQPQTDHPFLQEIAKGLALVGYTILAMQFVLAGRYKWLDRAFGLDLLFQFHRQMGVCAGVFLLAHPVLYAVGGGEELFKFEQPWEISLGRVALLVLCVLVVTSTARRALSIEFETWRGVHNGLALSVLGLGFGHSVAAGGDLGTWPMRALWTGVLGVAVFSYLRLKLMHPRLARNAFEVVKVQQETHDVCTLELRPLGDGGGMQNLPGQFCFLTLHRDKGPVEEHPFTISSSADDSGRMAVTIKASGDFTSTIPETAVGDRAIVSGPYGRFSYVLHPNEDKLVFIVGGVGLTPALSMLRHMRAIKADVTVLLLYGNREERDIIAREELAGLVAAGSCPVLEVVHILSGADESWTGSRGWIDGPLIQRHAEAYLGEAPFYLCGPPVMLTSVTKALGGLGVPPSRIRFERFAL